MEMKSENKNSNNNTTISSAQKVSTNTKITMNQTEKNH